MVIRSFWLNCFELISYRRKGFWWLDLRSSDLVFIISVRNFSVSGVFRRLYVDVDLILRWSVPCVLFVWFLFARKWIAFGRLHEMIGTMWWKSKSDTPNVCDLCYQTKRPQTSVLASECDFLNKLMQHRLKDSLLGWMSTKAQWYSWLAAVIYHVATF